MIVQYLHLPSGARPPDLGDSGYFRAVVIAAKVVDPAWREIVTHWLVRSGCRYMMAWGADCSAWHYSADAAAFDAFGEIDDSDETNFVMTTEHDGEPLSEVLWFSHFVVGHPVHDLESTLLIDISETARRDELLAEYEAAIAAE